MTNLFEGRDHGVDGETPTIQRLVAAYRFLGEMLPADIRSEGLPAFVEWLMHRVSLVEIAAGDGEHGLEMFQRINARGKPLTPMDYLKSFLLSGTGLDYPKLDRQWRNMVSKLDLDSGTGTAAPPATASSADALRRHLSVGLPIRATTVDGHLYGEMVIDEPIDDRALERIEKWAAGFRRPRRTGASTDRAHVRPVGHRSRG